MYEDLGAYLTLAWLVLVLFVLIPIFIIYPRVPRPLVREVPWELSPSRALLQAAYRP
jgi:hypothetical protein